MDPSNIITITQQALWLVLKLAGPIVLVAAAVGLLIAFIQAATQLQEQTVQFAVKFFAIVFAIFIFASVMGASLFQYTDLIFSTFPDMVLGS